jgi:hypothetical protein
LLRDKRCAEPAEYNVAERMGLLLTREKIEREEIARNVREAYRLRARQDISPIAPREIGSVAIFLRNAHKVIGFALGNAGAFESVSDFANFVDSSTNLAGIAG